MNVNPFILLSMHADAQKRRKSQLVSSYADISVACVMMLEAGILSKKSKQFFTRSSLLAASNIWRPLLSIKKKAGVKIQRRN